MNTIECAWCGHTERHDLRPVYTSWGVLIFECISDVWCNMRSVAGQRSTQEPGRMTPRPRDWPLLACGAIGIGLLFLAAVALAIAAQ